MKKEDEKLITRDYLAIERTRLANERTFLAYFRTFIVMLSSGFAIVKLEILHEIEDLGLVLILTSPLILLVGIIRLFYVKGKIRKYYSNADNVE